MSKPEIPNTTLQVKESLFKRYENLTVLSIFASFVAIVVLVQLISTGGSRFPTFISPVNIVNILQQVAVPGIVAISMTMVMVSGGIDLSVGMLASLVSIIVVAWDLPVASRRRSVDPPRRHVGDRPRDHHGVHHFQNPHRTVHHHARRNDLVPGDRVAALAIRARW